MSKIAETVETTMNLLLSRISDTLKARYACTVHVGELRQGFNAPCFFVEEVRSSSRRIGSRRLERRQSFVVHYYPNGFNELEIVDKVIYEDDNDDNVEHVEYADMSIQPETLTREAYTVAEELYRLLERVELSGKLINNNPINVVGTGMNYSVNGGVLHFNVDYNYHLLEEQLGTYMEKLEQTNKLKGG